MNKSKFFSLNDYDSKQILWVLNSLSEKDKELIISRLDLAKVSSSEQSFKNKLNSAEKKDVQKETNDSRIWKYLIKRTATITLLSSTKLSSDKVADIINHKLKPFEIAYNKVTEKDISFIEDSIIDKYNDRPERKMKINSLPGAVQEAIKQQLIRAYYTDEIDDISIMEKKMQTLMDKNLSDVEQTVDINVLYNNLLIEPEENTIVMAIKRTRYGEITCISIIDDNYNTLFDSAFSPADDADFRTISQYATSIDDTQDIETFINDCKNNPEKYPKLNTCLEKISHLVSDKTIVGYNMNNDIRIFCKQFEDFNKPNFNIYDISDDCKYFMNKLDNSTGTLIDTNYTILAQQAGFNSYKNDNLTRAKLMLYTYYSLKTASSRFEIEKNMQADLQRKNSTTNVIRKLFEQNREY